MKRNRLSAFILIVVLIAITGATMMVSSGKAKMLLSSWISPIPEKSPLESRIVNISANLIQDKVLQGSDGIVNLALVIQAAEILEDNVNRERHVDMVVVLDRSGSMKGKKIEDARRAILKLLSGLTEKDRFALITYSESVRNHSGLLNVSRSNRAHLESIIYGTRASGGTNLGAGLKEGINVLLTRIRNGNTAKVILISDGLANRGITNPRDLGRMAGIAIEKEFSISTVGVGSDFNEYLMTTIADRGTGTYYYLENPDAFAEVFQKEFIYSKNTVASGVAVHIPLNDGISLVNAAGYPISVQGDNAVFYPGDLRSGQTRKLFLSLRIPSDTQRNFQISDIKVKYQHNGQSFESRLNKSFSVACIKNREEVYSSIDKSAWTRKVLQEDFNRLRQEVAHDLKAGKKEGALDRIERYYKEQKTINTRVGSQEVDDNLNKDLEQLRGVVEDTFHGAPSAVSEKQKRNSKSLQYEGYKGRR
ncbi:MAG: VWA domain-containing protein [Desulfobacterales bacterium]|jgi:Ca-activated chloride channel family protein